MSGSSENALTVLLKMVKDHGENRKDAIISNGCQDFAEYRHQCGIVHGLLLAEKEIQDLLKRIEDA